MGGARSWLRADLIAGLTVAALVIPKSGHGSETAVPSWATLSPDQTLRQMSTVLRMRPSGFLKRDAVPAFDALCAGGPDAEGESVRRHREWTEGQRRRRSLWLDRCANQGDIELPAPIEVTATTSPVPEWPPTCIGRAKCASKSMSLDS